MFSFQLFGYKDGNTKWFKTLHPPTQILWFCNCKRLLLQCALVNGLVGWSQGIFPPSATTKGVLCTPCCCWERADCWLLSLWESLLEDSKCEAPCVISFISHEIQENTHRQTSIFCTGMCAKILEFNCSGLFWSNANWPKAFKLRRLLSWRHPSQVSLPL